MNHPLPQSKNNNEEMGLEIIDEKKVCEKGVASLHTSVQQGCGVGAKHRSVTKDQFTENKMNKNCQH